MSEAVVGRDRRALQAGGGRLTTGADNVLRILVPLFIATSSLTKVLMSSKRRWIP